MAGRIPQHFIDDLLSRTDIVDVISSRIQLKRAGSNHKACCPFHGEKTPSFSVSQTKQFYHCFGCGVHGSAIGFLMEYDGMHFVDAIETLAEMAGVEVVREQTPGQLPGSTGPSTDQRPLFDLMDSVTHHYIEALKQSNQAVEYLKQRGISGETAKRFKLGYAADGYGNLDTAFASKKKDLEVTGMLAKNDRGNVYARFRHRVMFPIRDRRGRVVGFGGRVLEKQEPKYLNSPETVLFQKGRELYGLYEARRAAQDKGFAIVVEGYMDVVALAEAGIGNAVATLGTSPNQTHCETLFRVVPGIVFCFDGDRAGREAAWRAAQAAIPCLRDGRDAHFLFLADGEDPDSLVRASGTAGFEAALQTRVHILDYLFEHLSEELNLSEVGGKARLVEKSKPLLAKMPAGMFRDLSYQKLEQVVGFPIDTVASEIPATEKARGAGNSSGFSTTGHSASATAGNTRGGTASSHPQAAANNGLPGNQRLSLMRRTVVLLLHYPYVSAVYADNDYTISNELRGAALLLDMLEVCRQQDNMTTGALIEHYRDTDYADTMLKLAIVDYMPDGSTLETDQANAEFKHCLKQLDSSRGHDAVGKVQPSKRTGLLSVSRGNKR